jgi:hypothetical protein
VDATVASRIEAMPRDLAANGGHPFVVAVVALVIFWEKDDANFARHVHQERLGSDDRLP